MTVDTLVQRMDEQFHPEYQEDYDNSGFLVGNLADEVRSVLVAVDLTESVCHEAIERGCNMIVTHHPVIFGKVRRITSSTALGRILLHLLSHGVAVYAAHTNLDNMQNGVNGILAKQLGLIHCSILKPQGNHPDVGAGMIGELPSPLSSQQFLRQIKVCLHLPAVRVNHTAFQAKPSVSRVAICGGAGSFLIEDARAAGADIYLTGDMKYHDFQRGEDIIVADIGHYESEQFVRNVLSDTLQAIGDGSFAVLQATCNDRWDAWI